MADAVASGLDLKQIKDAAALIEGFIKKLKSNNVQVGADFQFSAINFASFPSVVDSGSGVLTVTAPSAGVTRNSIYAANSNGNPTLSSLTLDALYGSSVNTPWTGFACGGFYNSTGASINLNSLSLNVGGANVFDTVGSLPAVVIPAGGVYTFGLSGAGYSNGINGARFTFTSSAGLVVRVFVGAWGIQ